MHFTYEPKSSQMGPWIAVLANSGEVPPPPLATGAVQRRRRSVLFPVPSDLDWTIQIRASLSQTEKKTVSARHFTKEALRFLIFNPRSNRSQK